MTPRGRLSLRLAFYGAVAVYLAGDLFFFHGPLRKKWDEADPLSALSIIIAKQRGVVARVSSYQITRDQLERAVRERLWLDGGKLEDLTPETRKIVRYAALDDLIDQELLRVKAKASAPQLAVTDEEINERLRRMVGRFVSKSEMESAMKSQGIASEQDLRDRLAARIQQEKYLEMQIGPLAQVTDEEARAWFDENQAKLATPERVRARHVFLATLERPQEEAKAALDAALADLTAGKRDFTALARELSDDYANKEQGGDLGWMTRSRLPADFSEAVFSLPVGKPSIVHTRIGWHLVEVTARKPSEPRTFEDAKPEVIAALEAVKRQEAVAAFRDALRRIESAKIQVFQDMVER